MKVESSADLEDAFAISILEVNGANAEPIHIYSPGNSYVASLKTIAKFFRKMAKIAKFNLKSMPARPSLSALKLSFQSYKRLIRDSNE